MANTPDPPSSSAQSPPGPSPASAPVKRVRVARILPLPSPRGTAVLAGAMLALGVAIGAAIGPAPNASFAGASRLLAPTLAALAGSGGDGHPGSPSAQPAGAQTPSEAAAPATTPSPAASSRAPAGAAAASEGSTGKASAPSSAPGESGTGAAKKNLPPVTHVWLIELSGTSFADALAQPSAAPYIDTQAVRSGTLLSGWSALDASALASDAALIASTPPQLLDTIVQPPCPEGAAAAQCAIGTPGALTAADEFLKASVASITASAAYHTSGMIVVAFASVVSASNAGLPAGAANATLTSEPPSGVLVISPFASAGTRPAIAFDPTSPQQSLEKVLHQ